MLCEATAPNHRKTAKIKIDHYDTHICKCENHPHKCTLFSTVPIDRTMKADARDHRVALHEADTGDPGVGALVPKPHPHHHAIVGRRNGHHRASPRKQHTQKRPVPPETGSQTSSSYQRPQTGAPEVSNPTSFLHNI